jgi:hypothetical protein
MDSILLCSSTTTYRCVRDAKHKIDNYNLGVMVGHFSC